MWDGTIVSGIVRLKAVQDSRCFGREPQCPQCVTQGHCFAAQLAGKGRPGDRVGKRAQKSLYK